MNYFENALKEQLGAKALSEIQKVRLGIAGAGGLGSNCAFNLVRSGFKHFTIVDFDKVEFSNLNRQFYFFDQVGQPKVEMLKKNLLLINPDLNINAMQVFIDKDNVEEIFKDCDVIVEAFDKVECKKMLAEEYLSSAKLVVSASGLAGWGRSDEIKTKKIKDNFYLIGDFVSEVGAQNPPISPRVNITAAKQADVILEYVVKWPII